MKRFDHWLKGEPAYRAGHVLTEAIPAAAPPSVGSLDPEQLEQTANAQRQSAFLRLPIEVRHRIYGEVFVEAGLAQHIYVKDGRYTHTACMTDHDAPDERQVEVEKIYNHRKKRFLSHPVWSRRLLSSWANHWRCEEAAMEAPPVPTPFIGLLLACKQMYLDCRKLLYERLTFVLHRVETALDFLSNAAVASEIRSLQLSLQIDVNYHGLTGEELPPELPWHGRHSDWLQLRDRLPGLENLRQLSVWLDAAGHEQRGRLLCREDTFEFDARLVPFLQVSVPSEPPELMPWWRDEKLFPPHPYVVGRGFADFWQEPSVVPEIMWYPEYSRPMLYAKATDHQQSLDISLCGIPRRRFEHLHYLGSREGASEAFRVWKGKKKISEAKGVVS